MNNVCMGTMGKVSNGSLNLIEGSFNTAKSRTGSHFHCSDNACMDGSEVTCFKRLVYVCRLIHDLYVLAGPSRSHIPVSNYASVF